MELCQCRCLPCGFESRLVQDFQRNIIYASSLSILGHCFNVVSLDKALNPQMLVSGENEYLVGRSWQCVWYVQCAEMAAGLHALREVVMVHELKGSVTR